MERQAEAKQREKQEVVAKLGEAQEVADQQRSERCVLGTGSAPTRSSFAMPGFRHLG